MNTVCSVLTPPGRGAVAVVGVAGPEADAVVEQFFRARNQRPLIEQPISRIVYGTWTKTSEDLVVCRRDAGLIEVHCHGGSQSVASIVADLRDAGCAEISWEEWLIRQGSDSLRIEAQIALSQAVSTRTATILLDQFHGALERELAAIRELLATDVASAQQRLAALLSTTELGSHLTLPWQVVIAGKPNVGKSSLINALVGYERAIVFDQPGTTRDVVTASTVIDGWSVMLSDTAGLHAATDELEAAGIKLARERLTSADLVVWVFDASELCENSWREMMDCEVAELGLSVPEKQLLVLNKIDCVSDVNIPKDVIATSATTGAGIDELLAAISAVLVPEVPLSGAAVLFTDRQRVLITDVLQQCRQGDVGGAGEILLNLLNGLYAANKRPCGELVV